ncbi:hypothetical protein D3C87_1746610 [compost metagenome]
MTSPTPKVAVAAIIPAGTAASEITTPFTKVDLAIIRRSSKSHSTFPPAFSKATTIIDFFEACL